MVGSHKVIFLLYMFLYLMILIRNSDIVILIMHIRTLYVKDKQLHKYI